MVVNNGPKCKLCRREGIKLMLKGERCFLEKCGIERRNYAPGQHGALRSMKKVGSEYAEQLREKQRIKRTYVLRERQFRKVFRKALKLPGVTGESFMRMSELRLDNIVYRMGFAPSRRSARQLVKHRHFLVNGQIVDIPSCLLESGAVIQVKESSKSMEIIHLALKASGRGAGAEWLQVDKVKLTGTVVAEPTRTQIATPLNEQMVVDLYSK